MYARMLIATDGSELATRALEHGLNLAKLMRAEVTIVTVTEPNAVIGAGYFSAAGTVFDPLPELIKGQEEAARRVLQAAETLATGAGVVVKTTHVENSFPAEGIIETANRIGAELIVMGSHGRRGLGRLLLGSQTGNVLAHSKIPVLVTR